MEYRYLLFFAITASCLIGLGSSSDSRAATPSAAELGLWQQALSTGEPADLQAFIERYPDSDYAEDARGLLATLGAVPDDSATVAVEEPSSEERSLGASASPGFEQPIADDAQSDKPRSIKELAEGTPLFSPVEGLPKEYWEGEVCSNCHNWDKASLCTQGEFYTGQERDSSARIQHPYGGFFKKALEQWAADGCR